MSRTASRKDYERFTPDSCDPCAHCPHILGDHIAQEGMCLYCKCLGWSPYPRR